MSFSKKSDLPLGMAYDDLPLWMRKTRREIDWALLVVIILCGVVIWPLLFRPGLPNNIGVRTEMSRAIEITESFHTGILYPRWAPDFNYGYGSALWNYLAPLPHYLTGLHHFLAQTSPETSLKLMMLFSLALAGLGMFGFVRRRWGTYAAIIAAAVYVYSPQLALVKPFLESDLAGLLAAGLFPVVLWAFDGVLQTRQVWDIGLASMTLAALILTDAPLNICLAMLVVGWIVWRSVISQKESVYWRHAWLAFGLGLGLSAFYWLPAWVERHAVHWEPVTEGASSATRGISPYALLGPAAPLDLSIVNPASTQSVGIAVWGLAVIAVLLVLSRTWRHVPMAPRPITRGDALQWRLAYMSRIIPEPVWEAVYFLLAGVIIFILVTPLASPVWDRLPIWPPFSQSDLIWVITACGAIGAAQLGYYLENTRKPLVMSSGVIGSLVVVAIAALPTIYPPQWPHIHAESDLSMVLRDEVRGHMIGSFTNGWLLPRSADNLPRISPILMASYQNGDLIDKVARDTLPPSAKVDVIKHDPQTERLAVETARPVTLTLLTFDFPGWRAAIDNKNVPIQPVEGSGFITVRVPTGRHEVVVRFTSTQPRAVGWLITGASLLTVLTLGLWHDRLLDMRYTLTQHRETTRSLSGITIDQRVVLGAAILLFGASGVLVRLKPNLVTVQSPYGTVRSADQQFPRALQGGIDLLAYDIKDNNEAHPGSTVTVTLYWRAARPDLPDYQVNVAIAREDGTGQTIGLAKHRHPGMIPSSQWPAWTLLDSYVRDEYTIPLSEGALPGSYSVIIQAGHCSQLNLLPCDTIEPLFVRDGRGTSLGQKIILSTHIEVKP